MAYTYKQDFPMEINLKAAVLHAPPFASVEELPDGSLEFSGFQYDLLQRLSIFAAADNVTLNFHLSRAPKQYGDAFDLVADDCLEVAQDPSQCNQLDMIVANYYATGDRALRADLSPAWMRSSISTVKYLDKTGTDYTTMAQASDAGVPVCLKGGTFYSKVVMAKFPNINFKMCDFQAECLEWLKAEECVLYPDDELQLRYLMAWDDVLQVTPESFNTQYIVWARSNRLDPLVTDLLNRWMLIAVTNATLDELYSHYFQKALCPVGTAGDACELPCDPDHGKADSRGVCVCESTKWVGDDCSIEVPEDVNSIPSTLKYLAYAMLGVNCLLISGCAAWLIWQRKSTQVLVSQPFFLMMVLVGCLISSCTIIALAQEDEGDGPVRACMAIPWLYSVGFSVTFGTLFAKIRRVYVIFRSAVDMRRNIVTVQETLIIIGAVLFIDLAILTVWTAVDPLHWQRTVILEDQFGVPLESEGHCTSNHWTIFAGIMAAFHLLLLGVACFMCYASRGIPTKFSEGKYVSIAMISNLQIFVVGVPILIILGTDSETSFFVRSVIIWMNDFVVVSLIFGNLIYSVHWDHDDTNGQGVKAVAGRAIQQYSRSMRFSSRHMDSSVQSNSMRNLSGHNANSDSARQLNHSGHSLNGGSDHGSSMAPPTLARKRSSGSRASVSRDAYQEERIPPMIIENPSITDNSREMLVSQLSTSGNFDDSDGLHSRTREESISKEADQDVGGDKTSWGGINLSSIFSASEISDSLKEEASEECTDEEGDLEMNLKPIPRRSLTGTQLVPVMEESRETTSTDATPDGEQPQSTAESQSTAYASSEAEMSDQVPHLPAGRPQGPRGVAWDKPLLAAELDEAALEEETQMDQVPAAFPLPSDTPKASELNQTANFQPALNPGRRRSSLWRKPLVTNADEGELELDQLPNLKSARKQGRRRSSLWKKPLLNGDSTLAAFSQSDSALDASLAFPPIKRKQGRRRSSLRVLDDKLIDAIQDCKAEQTAQDTSPQLDDELVEALDGSAEALQLALTEGKSALDLLKKDNEVLASHRKQQGRRRSSFRALDEALIEAMADCSAKSQASTSSRTLPLDHELVEALEGSSQSLQRALNDKKCPGPLEKIPSENETDQTSSGFFELDEEDAEANKPKRRHMEDESDVTLRTAGTGSSMELRPSTNLVSVGDS